jgi:hypothetical protein
LTGGAIKAKEGTSEVKKEQNSRKKEGKKPWQSVPRSHTRRYLYI